MKLLINTTSTFKGGSVQVAHSFVEESRHFGQFEYHIVLGKLLSTLVNPSDYPENYFFYSIGYRPATRVFSFKSPDTDLKNLEKSINPDAVFTTSGPAYWRPRVPHLVGYNLPHYIYGDSPFFKRLPYHKRLKWNIKGEVLRYFFKRDADAYVVQSDDVNQRLRQWLKTDRVYTVSNTFSSYYDSPKSVANKLPPRKENEFRFLTLSSWYPHKNLDIISKIIEVLPDQIKHNVRFVLTLPVDSFNGNFSLEAKKYIINTGPVKPEEGPALYQECDALFLPTLLECFSASYAEAMKMGKPVLTSDLSFAHAICGKAAVYADPLNPYLIAEKIVELIEHPLLQEQLVQEGLKQLDRFVSARKRAEEYLRICKKLVYEQK